VMDPGFEVLAEIIDAESPEGARVPRSPALEIGEDDPYPKRLLVFTDADLLARMQTRHAAVGRMVSASKGSIDQHALLREMLLAEGGTASLSTAAGSTSLEVQAPRWSGPPGDSTALFLTEILTPFDVGQLLLQARAQDERRLVYPGRLVFVFGRVRQRGIKSAEEIRLGPWRTAAARTVALVTGTPHRLSWVEPLFRHPLFVLGEVEGIGRTLTIRAAAIMF
jgi:hypothetical protein